MRQEILNSEKLQEHFSKNKNELVLLKREARKGIKIVDAEAYSGLKVRLRVVT